MIPESVELVHPLTQDCDDANVAVGEPASVDEVPLAEEEEPLDAEPAGMGLDITPRDSILSNAAKSPVM